MKAQLAVVEEISKIGKQTQEKLSELNIPPYPKYYKERFLDELHKSNDESIRGVIKKYPQLLCINSQADVEKQKSLDIALKGATLLDQTNKNILNLINQNATQLQEYQDKKIKIAPEVLELFESFHKSLFEEIKIQEESSTKLHLAIDALQKEQNLQHLTKLYNENVLKSDLKKIVEFGKDRALSTHLILMDADDFTKINDKYGRIVGDKIFIYISNLLQNTLRQGAKVYHIKDDEFGILLNRVSKDDVLSTATRVLKEINQSRLSFKGDSVNVTFSMGVVSHKKNDSEQMMIDRAKEALKEAKTDGKNCFKEA